MKKPIIIDNVKVSFQKRNEPNVKKIFDIGNCQYKEGYDSLKISIYPQSDRPLENKEIAGIFKDFVDLINKCVNGQLDNVKIKNMHCYIRLVDDDGNNVDFIEDNGESLFIRLSVLNKNEAEQEHEKEKAISSESDYPEITKVQFNEDDYYYFRKIQEEKKECKRRSNARKIRKITKGKDNIAPERK